MTPEERMEAHEQWLLDHDRDMKQIREVLGQTAEIQRKQSEILLEISQHVARLLDRE